MFPLIPHCIHMVYLIRVYNIAYKKLIFPYLPAQGTWIIDLRKRMNTKIFIRDRGWTDGRSKLVENQSVIINYDRWLGERHNIYTRVTINQRGNIMGDFLLVHMRSILFLCDGFVELAFRRIKRYFDNWNRPFFILTKQGFIDTKYLILFRSLDWILLFFSILPLHFSNIFTEKLRKMNQHLTIKWIKSFNFFIIMFFL